MDVKCRVGSLGKGELCRTTVAFDLACRALGCPVPRGTIVKLSSAPEAVYASSLCTAQCLVGKGKRYTCEEVAKEVTDMRVGIKAAAELKKYQVRGRGVRCCGGGRVYGGGGVLENDLR